MDGWQTALVRNVRWPGEAPLFARGHISGVNDYDFDRWHHGATGCAD
jgi:hypothetical protein